jgi:hypothetical protein
MTPNNDWDSALSARYPMLVPSSATTSSVSSFLKNLGVGILTLMRRRNLRTVEIMFWFDCLSIFFNCGQRDARAGRPMANIQALGAAAGLSGASRDTLSDEMKQCNDSLEALLSSYEAILAHSRSYKVCICSFMHQPIDFA